MQIVAASNVNTQDIEDSFLLLTPPIIDCFIRCSKLVSNFGKYLQSLDVKFIEKYWQAKSNNHAHKKNGAIQSGNDKALKNLEVARKFLLDWKRNACTVIDEFLEFSNFLNDEFVKSNSILQRSPKIASFVRTNVLPGIQNAQRECRSIRAELESLKVLTAAFPEPTAVPQNALQFDTKKKIVLIILLVGLGGGGIAIAIYAVIKKKRAKQSPTYY